MYKIGTRVKLVRVFAVDRDVNIGITGIVVPYNLITTTKDVKHDIAVKVDSSYYGGQRHPVMPAGTVSAENSDNWEPIVPEGSNVPSQMSIKELLDANCYDTTHEVWDRHSL